jgi:hypothetical protein
MDLLVSVLRLLIYGQQWYGYNALVVMQKEPFLCCARLAAREIWTTVVCVVASRSAPHGGWLRPLVLLPLSAGCGHSFCCPGGWLLPLVLLPLAAGCGNSFCCLGGWLLPLVLLPWRLAAATRSAALAAGFRLTVSMDVLRFNHPTSDTT